MPGSLEEKSAINRMLGTHGLPPLESGQGLIVALAFLVQDHEHLRSLLIRCEPENRVDMYNALKPNLRFEARPLDSYVAESALRADQQGLPTIDEDGVYHFPAPAPSDAEIAAARASTGALFAGALFAAQDVVNQAFAKERLWLVCSKCTKEAVFTGDTKADAVLQARMAGWAYWERGEGQPPGEICPECPVVRKSPPPL